MKYFVSQFNQRSGVSWQKGPCSYTANHWLPFQEDLSLIRLEASKGFSYTQPLSIPSLPLIKYIQQYIPVDSYKNIKNTIFYFVQHPFRSTFSLIKNLIQMGANPKNIFFCDKYYSTPESANHIARYLGINYYPFIAPNKFGSFSASFKEHTQMIWSEIQIKLHKDKHINTVIVGDDAGYALSSVPNFITMNCYLAGFEQTTSGVHRIKNASLMFPVVSVASSAVKQQLESELIAKDVTNQIETLFQKADQVSVNICGVVGNGNVGKAVIKKLLELGISVLVYDSDPNAYTKLAKQVTLCKSIEVLVNNSDIIFGCSGTDILANTNLNKVIDSAKNRMFVSCSSGDIEWRSLLIFLQENILKNKLLLPPLSDLIFRTNKEGLIIIRNGGCPINFNRTEETIILRDIQLTRSLLWCALAQAMFSASKVNKGLYYMNDSHELTMLSPELQLLLAKEWISEYASLDFPHKTLEVFKTVSAIKAHSDGTYRLFPLNSQYKIYG